MSAIKAGLVSPSISIVFQKAHAIQAMIEGLGHACWHNTDFQLAGRRQCERETAMCDDRADLALALRALYVDMDPLTIARLIGKLVDARLIHGDPVGDAEILPDKLNSPRVLNE